MSEGRRTVGCDTHYTPHLERSPTPRTHSHHSTQYTHHTHHTLAHSPQPHTHQQLNTHNSVACQHTGPADAVGVCVCVGSGGGMFAMLMGVVGDGTSAALIGGGSEAISIGSGSKSFGLGSGTVHCVCPDSYTRN